MVVSDGLEGQSMSQHAESKLTRDQLLKMWDEGEPVEFQTFPVPTTFSARSDGLHNGCVLSVSLSAPLNTFTAAGLVVLESS
jgi:hypothetical protein